MVVDNIVGKPIFFGDDFGGFIENDLCSFDRIGPRLLAHDEHDARFSIRFNVTTRFGNGIVDFCDVSKADGDHLSGIATTSAQEDFADFFDRFVFTRRLDTQIHARCFDVTANGLFVFSGDHLDDSRRRNSISFEFFRIESNVDLPLFAAADFDRRNALDAFEFRL